MGKKGKKVARVTPVHPGDERVCKKGHRCSLLSPGREPENISVITGDSGHAKDDFIELIAQNLKAQDFDEISSRIIGTLFIETEEMSLEEIAIETGYSLSAVSTAMKNLSQFHVVRRFNKPGSKKAFFFLDKNLVSIGTQSLRTKFDNVIIPSKKILPEIIEKYEAEGLESSASELAIVEHYYRQILKLENIVDDLLTEMDNIDKDSE
ncbi:hypothetical protein [Methanolobus sp. WCC4]|uniref:GbsR/MarR family transcriptional regulator n=1 Tax=Methanolobus sp. WCC4 TaxID=3125784 RepID=UPI0030F68952